MILSELLKLKEQVINDEITIDDAKELLYKDKNIRSWHTKEWEELKKAKLKDKCEQCGSTEKLTIQHKFHPESFGEIRRRIDLKYMKLVEEQYSKEELLLGVDIEKYFMDNYSPVDKECCPSCDSYNLLIRKTLTPRYRCNKCAFEFDTPTILQVPKLIDDSVPGAITNTTTKIGTSIIINKIYYKKIHSIKNSLYKDIIDKETFIEVINQNISYQRLDDVLTYCKKCAFMFDKNDMDLCPQCQKNYKKTYYKTCNECKFG